MKRRNTIIVLAFLAVLLLRESGGIYFELFRSGHDSQYTWTQGPPAGHTGERAVALQVVRDGQLLGVFHRDGDAPGLELKAEFTDRRIGGLWWLPFWKPVRASYECLVTDADGESFGVFSWESKRWFFGLCSIRSARGKVSEDMDESAGPGITNLLGESVDLFSSIPREVSLER